MKLKRPLPVNRSFNQVWNHYLVEKSIAEKLKNSDHEERKRIYSTMYQELFTKVPDHPRKTRNDSEQLTASSNKEKFLLVRRFIKNSFVFAEFGPGDCRFVYEIAKYVNFVYGIDISDQRNHKGIIPVNFKLIIYDGDKIPDISNNSVDIVFSDQLIEHLHPEDTCSHFELVYSILKPGGKYIFRTPHVLSGPHDISKYFSDEPECFHLKEWSYTEIKKMLTDLNYSDFSTWWHARGISLKLPYYYFKISEQILGILKRKLKLKKPAKYLIPVLYGVAIK